MIDKVHYHNSDDYVIFTFPLQDGKWYWVKFESISVNYEAPAMYKKDVDCFYSYEFGGIPQRLVNVLREA